MACSAIACSGPVGLENADLPGLRGLADSVDQTRAMNDIAEFVDAHKSEQPLPFDCNTLPEGPLGNEIYCHLTHENARDLMRDKLADLGLEVVGHSVSDGVYSTEVLTADLPGTVNPEEIVLVGAHYDAFYAGADDNTTGVAAVLELARVLSTAKFERTIRFVGFDMEEFGLIGSVRYVESLPDRNAVVAAIVFDCIGFFSTEPGSQEGLLGFPVPDTADFTALLANDDSAQLASDMMLLNEELGLAKLAAVVAPADGTHPLTGNLFRSDHAPFWWAAIPAMQLTDTTNFRNPHYHKDTDTIDTLEPTFFARTIAISAAALGYWARGPR